MNCASSTLKYGNIRFVEFDAKFEATAGCKFEQNTKYDKLQLKNQWKKHSCCQRAEKRDSFKSWRGTKQIQSIDVLLVSTFSQEVIKRSVCTLREREKVAAVSNPALLPNLKRWRIAPCQGIHITSVRVPMGNLPRQRRRAQNQARIHLEYQRLCHKPGRCCSIQQRTEIVVATDIRLITTIPARPRPNQIRAQAAAATVHR